MTRDLSLPTKAWFMLRSALFFIFMALVTFTLGPYMIVRPHAPFESRYRTARLWAKLMVDGMRLICGLRYEISGLENLPAQNGVILCKHQSAWETFALQALFPPIAFVLKRELLDIPVWGRAVVAACDPIAINRSTKTAALKQMLRLGQERLKQGRWLVLFPEGTRVAPGRRVTYATSGGILAERNACPAVPVAHNAGQFWARNGLIIHPGVVKVAIGPALDPSLGAQAITDQAEAWIEARVAEFSGIPVPPLDS